MSSEKIYILRKGVSLGSKVEKKNRSEENWRESDKEV